MKLKIEKDIPIPPITMPARVKQTPFKDLEVGDSFLANEKLLNAALTFSRSPAGKGYKFTRRKLKDRKDGINFRVWRTE